MIFSLKIINATLTELADFFVSFITDEKNLVR